MIKYMPLLLSLTMCAPAPVTPPANALEVEEQLMLELMEKIQGYRPSEQKTEPDDAINSALENFWEETYGSNDPTESEELLQLPSDGD
tara:strand:- start:31 stop:294 length:264 start_codon:yes stop_codon:yes gene_type:complete